MSRTYAQHHDGVEEAPATAALGVEERRPAPPSPIALGLFFRNINEKENHNAIVESMEPKHGDLDHTDEATSADFAAWTDLPRDTCRLILDRLGAFEILNFPLVCRPWADVYAEKRRLQPGGLLQPGAPTLLTSPSDGGWDIEDDYQRGLFFISTFLPRETFLVEVEGLSYRSWIGGKDEWLVTQVRSSYYAVELLNPITRARVSLPNVLPACLSLNRVQLCRTPTEAAVGYFAIAISDNMLAYTMAGCSHWITLENPKIWMIYSDAILHGAKIIAICCNGELWSWDLDHGGANPKLVTSSLVKSGVWTQFYLILAPCAQDNILIFSPYGEHGVVLHEVNIEAKIIREVCDIGNRALFLGPNYPFYVPVSVPSGDLKTNHVYIASKFGNDVFAIDLSLKDLPSNVSLVKFSRPFNPNQTPMWFRPAFP